MNAFHKWIEANRSVRLQAARWWLDYAVLELAKSSSPVAKQLADYGARVSKLAEQMTTPGAGGLNFDGLASMGHQIYNEEEDAGLLVMSDHDEHTARVRDVAIHVYSVMVSMALHRGLLTDRSQFEALNMVAPMDGFDEIESWRGLAQGLPAAVSVVQLVGRSFPE